MYKNFDEIMEKALALKEKKTISIAAAADEKIIQVTKRIKEMNLCKVILVDDQKKIENLASKEGLDLDGITVIDSPDLTSAALTAVEQVSSGKADVFVKGRLNTSDFLRAVLNKEVGLKASKVLSVMMAYDVPVVEKLMFISDGGMVIAPDLDEKVEILKNSVSVLHNMGIREPKVALLSANEKVSEKMQSSVDADAICKMAAEGKMPTAVYEGPIAFDVAMKPQAAKEKGIQSRITGNVDLFLVPNIECGNCLGKSIGYFGNGQSAGIVIGAAKPVVMTSRAATVKGKLTSIAWALLACNEDK